MAFGNPFRASWTCSPPIRLSTEARNYDCDDIDVFAILPKFRGAIGEDVLAFMKEFISIVNSLPLIDCTEDDLRLKYFPLCFKDQVRNWYFNLESDSIFKWKQMEEEFLIYWYWNESYTEIEGKFVPYMDFPMVRAYLYQVHQPIQQVQETNQEEIVGGDISFVNEGDSQLDLVNEIDELERQILEDSNAMEEQQEEGQNQESNENGLEQEQSNIMVNPTLICSTTPLSEKEVQFKEEEVNHEEELVKSKEYGVIPTKVKIMEKEDKGITPIHANQVFDTEVKDPIQVSLEGKQDNKRKLEEIDAPADMCIKIIPKEPPPKLRDKGSFFIPLSIKYFEFNGAVHDEGIGDIPMETRKPPLKKIVGYDKAIVFKDKCQKWYCDGHILRNDKERMLKEARFIPKGIYPYVWDVGD